MVLVYNTIQIVINIKADGNKINVMVKVHSGWQIPKISLDVNILVIGNMTQNKDEVPCSIKPVTGMMVCGWIVYHMDKEE